MTKPDTNSVELRQCPFCGNGMLNCYKLDYRGDKWCIRCDHDECYVKPHAVFDEDYFISAIKWNKRRD